MVFKKKLAPITELDNRPKYKYELTLEIVSYESLDVTSGILENICSSLGRGLIVYLRNLRLDYRGLKVRYLSHK